MLANTLCVLKVMSPQRSDLVLTADVPHCKADVLVFNRLDVETCKRKAKQQLSIDCDTCVKEQFLSSEQLPIVGMVVTISPSLSLYRIVVLPAASRPTIKILISFLPKRPLKRFANMLPMILQIKIKT